jgi:hypothetical protein
MSTRVNHVVRSAPPNGAGAVVAEGYKHGLLAELRSTSVDATVKYRTRSEVTARNSETATLERAVASLLVL